MSTINVHIIYRSAIHKLVWLFSHGESDEAFLALGMQIQPELKRVRLYTIYDVEEGDEVSPLDWHQRSPSHTEWVIAMALLHDIIGMLKAKREQTLAEAEPMGEAANSEVFSPESPFGQPMGQTDAPLWGDFMPEQELDAMLVLSPGSDEEMDAFWAEDDRQKALGLATNPHHLPPAGADGSQDRTPGERVTDRSAAGGKSPASANAAPASANARERVDTESYPGEFAGQETAPTTSTGEMRSSLEGKQLGDLNHPDTRLGTDEDLPSTASYQVRDAVPFQPIHWLMVQDDFILQMSLDDWSTGLEMVLEERGDGQLETLVKQAMRGWNLVRTVGSMEPDDLDLVDEAYTCVRHVH